MAEILLVDDDPLLREGFEQLLQDEGYTVVSAQSGTEALKKLDGISPQCIVMDVRLPGMDGLETLRTMREREDCPPVVIMTAYGTTDTAIEAMRLGAFDYILKPFEIPHILELIERAVAAGIRQKAHEDGSVHPEDDGPGGVRLVGSSGPMQDIYKSIGRVAPTDALVLLRGESGTGKEVTARSIWRYSPRSHRPFVVINCVAIPDTLLESELFGYERGSFTGADQSRAGRIEKAAGGTVFLDEIGDMPLAVQAKFLRLLQERQVERIGAPNPVTIDVRIIAATNVDLEKAVREGRFREDLYYRLKVVTLWLPPLRARLGDIPELARYLLARHARELGTHNPGIEPEALEYLETLSWPGNVRELANLLQKVLVFTDGPPICRNDILKALEHDARQTALQKGRTVSGSGEVSGVGAETAFPGRADAAVPESDRSALEEGASSAPETTGPARSCQWKRDALDALIDGVLEKGGESVFDACMDIMGRAVVRRALVLTGGNRSKAARLLGLSRPTLLARMEKYGLKVETHIS